MHYWNFMLKRNARLLLFVTIEIVHKSYTWRLQALSTACIKAILCVSQEIQLFFLFFPPARTPETIVILTAHFVSSWILHHKGKEFRVCAPSPWPSSPAAASVWKECCSLSSLQQRGTTLLSLFQHLPCSSLPVQLIQ